MKNLTVYLSVLTFLTLSGMFAHGGQKAQEDAKTLFQKKCSICHSIKRPTSTKKTATGWRKTVLRMKKNGCPITDEEAQTIIDYLVENYGK